MDPSAQTLWRRHSSQGRPPAGRGAEPHQGAGLRALFPDRLRSRPLRDRARHIEPGARIGGQFGCLLYSRSEEHTSELPSLMRISSAVFLLNNKIYTIRTIF